MTSSVAVLARQGNYCDVRMSRRAIQNLLSCKSFEGPSLRVVARDIWNIFVLFMSSFVFVRLEYCFIERIYKKPYHGLDNESLDKCLSMSELFTRLLFNDQS